MIESEFLTIRAVKACRVYYYYYGENTSKRKFFKVKHYDSNGQVVSDWDNIEPNYWTSLEEGDYIRIYGYGGSSVNDTFNYDLNNYYHFYFGTATGTNVYGEVEISGHLTSLISSGSTNTITKDYCFCKLFSGSTNTVIDASQLILPTNTTRYCYSNMFKDCQNLTAIPQLPATTLAEGCYASMFNNCGAITEDITLPATTLASNSYSSMFYKCVGIKNVKIEATSLDYPNCCYQMFYGCSGLRNMELANYDSPMDSTATDGWLSSTSTSPVQTQTITQPQFSTWNKSTVNMHIPYNWNVKGWKDESKYLTLTAVSSSTITFKQSNTSKVFCYQVNGTGEYETVTTATTISLQEGDYVRFYCPNTGDTTFNTAGGGSSSIWTIIVNGGVKASGYVTSLINENCPNSMGNFCFYKLFGTYPNRNGIVDASELILPTTCSKGCYQYMFQCCDIKHAPKLTAKILAEECYYGMFERCTYLEDEIILPATYIPDGAYRTMYIGCSGITSATLYAERFNGKNPRTSMFSNCIEFNSLSLPSLINAPTDNKAWMNNVSPTGTVYQNSEATWDTTTSAMKIPSGWTLQTYSKYWIDVNSNNPLKCTITGDGMYDPNDTVTITATPAEGYVIGEWIDDNTQQVIQSSGTSLTLTATDNRSITVKVNPVADIRVGFRTNVPSACTLSGGGYYLSGQTVTLTVSNVAQHFSIGDWINSDTQQTIQSSGTSYTFTVTGNTSIYVTLVEDPYITVDVNANPSSAATITGGGKQYVGETVNLVATPVSGNAITNWYDNDAQQVIQTSANTYTFTASEDRDITVNLYQRQRVYVGASARPDGIDVSFSGTGYYYVGETATLTVNYDHEHYTVDHWSNGETGDTITVIAQPYDGGYISPNSYICYLRNSRVDVNVVYAGGAWDIENFNVTGEGSYPYNSEITVKYNGATIPTGRIFNGLKASKVIYPYNTVAQTSGDTLTWVGQEDVNVDIMTTSGFPENTDYLTISFPDEQYEGGHRPYIYINYGKNGSGFHPYYKLGDGEWTRANGTNRTTYYEQRIDIPQGQSLKLTSAIEGSTDQYYIGYEIVTWSDAVVSGKLSSLWNSNGYDNTVADYSYTFSGASIGDISGLILPEGMNDFTGLFKGFNMPDASKLKFPKTYAPGAFEYMFEGNPSYALNTLEIGPKLPYTSLKEDCYKGMFKNAQKLRKLSTFQLNEMDPYYQSGWMDNIATSGTITFNGAVTWDPEAYRSKSYGYPTPWNYNFNGNIPQKDLGLDGLYIADQRVDEFIEMDVSMTYQSRDTSNPEAVRSSFSKTVELPGTQNNNKIFGQLYNVNATLTSFNPKERVEFKLYRNSEIIEKGYITLDEINNNNGNITYNITLYGGLGDFFYSLMYDEEGNEKTMDKLNYNLDVLNSHLLTFWDFEHIKTGWDKLSNPFDPTDRTPENFIVACPTYGGFGDEMDNDKAVLLSRWYNGPTDEYGYSFRHGPVSWDYTPDSGSTFYTDKNGWIPLECQREMSEWETRDFRSSQQRPAIRTKLLFDAICNPENNGGWNVEVSPSVSADTYINDSWIVCDRLQFEDGESNLSPIIVKSYRDREVVATVAPAVQMTEDEDEFDFSDMTNVHMRLCAYPMVYITNTPFVQDDSVRKIFTAFEARAFLRDHNDQYVSGYTPEWSESQHKYVPSTNPANAYHKFDQVYLANAFVFWMTDNYGNRSNIVVLMNHLLKNNFHWVEDEYREYIAQHYSASTSDVTIYNKNIVKRKNANGDVWFVCEDVMPMTMDCPSNSDVKVQYHFEIIDFPWAISSVGKKYNLEDCRYYNGTAPDFGVSYDGQIPSWDWTMDAVNDEAINGYNSYSIIPQHTYDLWTIDDEENNYIGLPMWRWDSFYIASGDDTEDDNFEQSWQAWQPVRFHNTFVEPIMDTDNEGAGNGYYEGQMSTVQSTSVTKELMFGRLGNAYDFLMTLSKLLSLRFRVDKDDKKVYIERVFEYYQDRTVDITDLVDYSKEIKVIPNVTDYKYLNYELPSPEDLYINKLYKARYHKNYDGYKFNTGVNLNNEVNEILESCPLNSTAEYQMKSPYFILVTEVPQPFLLPYVKETLFLESGGTSSNQTITLEKTGRSSVIRMDSITGPKMLCMYDNEYKSVDTNMVMAFFNGFIPWKCVVSDNVPAMEELQDKKCIMSMYQHFADDILDVINIPPFSPTPVPIDDGYIYAPPSTKVNTVDRVAVLRDQIPQFTTTLSGKTSLVYPPEHPFTDIGECIYPQYHQWSEDMYDRNGKKVELYMRIPKDIKPNDMLRIFLYWENSIWIVEDIQDYDLTKPDTVKVTLVKVRNKANYLLNE